MEEVNFKGDMLPTNGEVFTYINSRTAYGKSAINATIREAATIIHNIWQKADACPLSVKGVIARCQKLVKDRRDFMIKIQRQNPGLAPSKDSLSDFTKKRRLPSVGRELSRRSTPSTYKKKPEGREQIVNEVRGLVEEIFVTLEGIQDEPPKKKRALRSSISAEQQWMSEVGYKLFDVFSEQEKRKVISNGQAFDEEFLEDQRGSRKLRIDLSKETEEYLKSQARNEERERRHKNYVLSATSGFASVSHEALTDEQDVGEDMEDPALCASDDQFFSAIKTRAAQNHEIESIMKGTCKRSTGTQTENNFFPPVSTRLTTKKSKTVSLRLNPRLLAAGSLMMGVAGVSTRQAITCLKIAGNVLFHQNYILPPSMEKEYRKKLKLRKKLAKMGMEKTTGTTTTSLEITRQAVAEVIETIEVEEEGQLQENIDTDEALESSLIDIEERSISDIGKKEVLSRMLCKPTALRTTHHLISTLGEQEQALEMIETEHVNLIPDGTARQGGWGKMAGAILKIGEKHRALRLQTIGSETHASWVETISHMVKRLALASGQDVAKIWQSIMVMVSDMCKVNMNLASDVAKQLGCAWKPGQAFCNLHPRLMMSRSIVDVWKKHQSKIGHDKVFPSLEYCNIDASNDSLVKQVLDALMSLASKQWAERSWNKYHEITEWMERKGIKNETGPLREIRFGELEAKSLTGAYHLDHIEQFLQIHTDIRNKLTCFLRSVFPMRQVIMFYWIGAALVGIHIGEPYVNLLMVKKAKMTELIELFPQLYKEMLNPPNNFTQLTEPAIPCLKGAWIDPEDDVDPPYPNTQIDFLVRYLAEIETKYLELFCREVSKEIAEGFKRQKGNIFGFGDGSQPQLNILDQVPEQHLDEIETTSIAVEQFFGEVDYKTRVSGGCQAKNKICDDLVIKHTEDLVQKRLLESNFNLKPLKRITQQIDKMQYDFDARQKSLMSAGLREDEAVILSKESQVQRVVRQCKESHGGPIQNLDELNALVASRTDEKSLSAALNLEIRYRKFTCLLKVATNNELFRQQGIDNKLRITHLKQLLTDDTRPKCHASMCDVEALYDNEQGCNLDQISTVDDSAETAINQPDDWFLNGCWPIGQHEQVVVLIETDFAIGTIEKCHEDRADLCLMKAVAVRGHPSLSHWTVVDEGEKISAPKESILQIRPVLQMKGRKKSLKFLLTNLNLIQEFVQALHTN